MSRIVSLSIVRQVSARSHAVCEYCKIPEYLSPVEFEIDHILAQQHGGLSVLVNLAWACAKCNSYKGPNMASMDPQSGEPSYLFNPRKDDWHVHFSMRDGLIVPRTNKGGATLYLLKMNDPDWIMLRRAYFKKHLLP